MKARLSVDSELFQKFAKSIYSGGAEIPVREVIQNSVDAVVRKNGVCTPEDLVVSIERKDTIDKNGEANVTWLVSCDDQGIGMSDDDIVNKFLCLGKSGKDDANEVGRFGVAKASIMAQKNWYVKSRQFYIDSMIVAEEAEVASSPKRVGTEVYFESETDNWGSSRTLQNIMAVMFGNDRKISVVENHASAEGDVSVVGKPRLIKKVKEVVKDSYTMTIWYGDKVEGTLFGHTLDNLIYYRLNGLVQFVEGFYSKLTMPVFVDFQITKRVDLDYPFTMGRDALKSEVKDLCSSSVNFVKENPKSAQVICEAQLKETAAVLYNGQPLFGILVGSRHTMDLAYDKNVWVKHDEAPIMNVMTIVRKLRPNDVKVLKQWARMMQLCLPNTQEFVIGAIDNTSGKNIQAMRVGYTVCADGVERTMFAINIDCDWSGMKGMMKMYQTAAHEATHGWFTSHNEDFVIKFHSILEAANEAYIDNIGYIKGIK